MLIELKIANFLSIREEQTFSFIGSNYSDELPDNYIVSDLPGMIGARVLKTAAIYGANASGKSNILSAINILTHFIANSFKLDPQGDTGAKPFCLDEEWTKRPTTFEITVIIDKVRYSYGLGLTQKRVTEEYLVAFPNGKAQTWFERSWDENTSAYIWSEQTENFRYENSIRESTRDNCSFISTGAQFKHPILTRLRNWFATELKVFTSGGSFVTSDHTAKLWFEADSTINSAVLALLTRADLGLTNVNVRKVPDEELKKIWPESLIKSINEHEYNFLLPYQYETQLSHKGQSGPVTLQFADESQGTQRMFELAGTWIKALTAGRVLCLDEIETSLHPFLVRDLIKLFLDPAINKNCAQLLFTTHNPLLLDQTLLRRDQFWFTEKDDFGATHLYPLTDYKPRPTEALLKGYLAGRYGGVPFVPEGLLSK